MKLSSQSRRLLRGAVLCLLLAPAAALAHGVPQFIYEEPLGANNPPDGGYGRVRWTDYSAYGFMDLWAYPGALPPFGWADPIPQGGLSIHTDGGIETHSTVDLIDWDTTNVPPGCYQPYARFDDFGDYYLFIWPGKIVVSSSAGTHPSVFIVNPRADWPNPDGGTVFELLVDVAEPDDKSTLTLRYAPMSQITAQTLIATIALDAGVGTQRFALDTRTVDAGQYALLAELSSADGERCAAYWPHVFTVTPPPLIVGADAGVDAGLLADAGTKPDAGNSHVELGEPEDAGRARIRVLPPPVADPGCGSTTSSLFGPLLLLALVPVARWMRYRRKT